MQGIPGARLVEGGIFNGGLITDPRQLNYALIDYR